MNDEHKMIVVLVYALEEWIIDSGDFSCEHETCDSSRMKLSCSVMISSFSGSGVVDENIGPTSKVLECMDRKQTEEYIVYKPSQLSSS